MTDSMTDSDFGVHGESWWSNFSRESADVFISFSNRAMGAGFSVLFISSVVTAQTKCPLSPTCMLVVSFALKRQHTSWLSSLAFKQGYVLFIDI